MTAPPLALEEPNVSLDQANGGREPEPLAGNPCGTAPRLSGGTSHVLKTVGESRNSSSPFRTHVPDAKEFIMAETTVRRVRHTSRTSESDRRNAAAALQRALDRRDNGGSTGH